MIPLAVEAMSPKLAPKGNAVGSVAWVKVEPMGMQRRMVFEAPFGIAQ